MVALVLSVAGAGTLGCRQASTSPGQAEQRLLRIPAPFLLSDVQRAEDAKYISWLTKAENSAALKFLDERVLKPVLDDTTTRGLTVTALEVSPNQLPDVHRIVANCASILRLERTPRVFVAERPGPLQIVVQNYTDSVIVIPSQVLRRFRNSIELRFIVGRELGHVRTTGHVRWLTALRQLQNSFGAKEEAIGPGTLLLPILCWSREAELTADRFGLLCCQDLNAAERAIVRMATGVDSFTAEAINVDAFLRQEETQQLSRVSDMRLLWREINRAAPFSPERVRELRRYHRSEQYAAL
jgi:Zn-dependent protease with chaperone function